MAWTKPKAREIKCGMEINMYGPGEDDERRNEDDLIYLLRVLPGRVPIIVP